MPRSSASRNHPRHEQDGPSQQRVQELLLALGVRSETAERLPELDSLWREIEDAGRRYPELSLEEDPPPAAAWPGAGGTAHAPPEVRARFEADLERVYRLAMPIARETLDALDHEQIRPELLGYDHCALSAGLTDLEDLFESGSWRGADGATLRGYIDWVGRRHPWRTTVAPPRRGEVSRIVDVLRRTPPGTLRPMTRTRNRLVLGVLVRIGLFMVRRNPRLAAVSPIAGHGPDR